MCESVNPYSPQNDRMAISRVDFCFITELVTRNPTMGITPLENGLFANLFIFDYFRSAFEVRLRCD